MKHLKFKLHKALPDTQGGQPFLTALPGVASTSIWPVSEG